MAKMASYTKKGPGRVHAGDGVKVNNSFKKKKKRILANKRRARAAKSIAARSPE